MSTQITPVRSKRSRLLALTTTLLVAFGGLVAVPTVANAAEGDVSNATLDWGVRESWRNYIGGGIMPNPDGGTEFIAPASASPAPYRWGSSGTGTFDAATGTGSFTAQGGVQWLFPGHGIDITLSGLSVSFDVNSGSGSILQGSTVIATFSGGTVNASAGAVQLTGAPAVATQGFTDIFGESYRPGAALDPVSFSFNYEEAAAPAVTTTTTLSADATSVEVGTAVNLTATVAPASAAGTVEFFNGSTSLGAPVAVASGVATLAANLAAGTHNLAAVFAPADAAAFVASTSSALEVTVTVPASAATTSVEVAADPAAPVLLGSAVEFSAAVTNEEDAAAVPAGSIEFFAIADGTDARVSLGSDDVDAGGEASVSTTALTAGGHQIVAVFTPTSATDFQSSEGFLEASSRGVVSKANFGVVDLAAPAPYEPGATAETRTGATATWAWSAYSAAWAKTVSGNATTDGATFTLTDGEVVADANGAVISFEATLTNSAYGGVAIMSVTDPALHLNADGSGVWAANVNGSEDRIVVGTFEGADALVGQNAVRTIEFDYEGTTASGTWAAGYTGAWPNGFIWNTPSSVRAFYYASGAGADANKPASPLTIDFEWPAVTELSLEVSPAAPVELGTDVTLTATVVPPAAEGEVEFFATSAVTGDEISLGAADVQDGVAEFTSDELIAGGHTFRAVYTSSNEFNSSEAFLETTGRDGSVSLTNYGVVDSAQTPVCTPAGEVETLEGVTASWAWSAYSAGWEKFAGGNVTVDGENFVLSNGVATVTDDCVSIAFTGTLRTEAYQNFFPEHGQWVELVNPVLTIDAAGNGAWVAGVRTGESVLNTDTSAPTVIAAIEGATFPNFAENTVSAEVDLAYADTTAKGTWSAGQTSAWGNGFVMQVPSSIRSFYYASGAGGDVNKPVSSIQLDWQIAPLTASVNGQSSDARVLQGQKVTFTAEPFRAGDVVSIVVNSDPVTLPSVTVGADGIATQTWNVPADFETGAHTVTFSTGSGAALRSVSLPFTVDALSTDGGSTPTDPQEVCVAQAVTGGSMTWEFKQSFKNYILGPIAHGTFTGGSFSATGGAVNAQAGGIGRVSFAGSINASGHDGTLNVRIQNPSVQITGPNSGVLYGTLTESGSGGYVAIANLSFSSVSATASSLSVRGNAATLTGAAAAAFGGFYGAGSALDPVSFTVSLGGEVACDNSTDPVELARTGATGDQLVPLVAVGALAMLLGFGLIRMRRQRVA